VIEAITSLDAIFALSGAVLLVFAAFTFADQTNTSRWGTGLFWALLGTTFAFGGILPYWVTGGLVIAMAVLDGCGLVRRGSHSESRPEEQTAAAVRYGWKIFVPVLMIPAVTYASSLVPWGQNVSSDRVVFVSLGYASIAAAIVALVLTRSRPTGLIQEGRRLADAIGAVIILPQLLAALGTLFTAAGVGSAIAKFVSGVIPEGNLFAVVLVCCLTIAGSSFLMGNSFAAFPVIMVGLAIPLLVRPFGADPAVVGILLLTCASCGTLCTPMAANFNIVPASLLEMQDSYGVIKFQAPCAAVMFAAHVLLLWAVAMR